MKGTRAGLFVLMVSLALALFAVQAKAAPLLYVADWGTSQVVVVDLKDYSFKDPIPVSTPYGISITPDGMNAYTANNDSATCSVIDLQNNVVTKTIDVGSGAQHVAIAPDGTPYEKRGYVANTSDGFISVLDTGSHSVIGAFDYGYMTYTAVSKDGQWVFATDTGGGVSWFDSTGNRNAYKSNGGWLACGVLSPDDKELYVSSPSDQCIYILDADPSGTNYLGLKGTIYGACGLRMLFSGDGSKLFVTNYWEDCVQIIDLAANPLEITPITIRKPVGLALTPDGTQLLVSGNVEVTPGVWVPGVGVIGVAGKTIIKNLTGFTWPAEIAIVAGGAEELQVAIDIKPGSSPNSINPKSQGRIPVAILSSPNFDAPARVNIGSLTFGPTGIEASPVHLSAQDVNGDGYPDLMCHFRTQDAGFQVGHTEGTLKGETSENPPLLFQGKDSVRIVPAK